MEMLSVSLLSMVPPGKLVGGEHNHVTYSGQMGLGAVPKGEHGMCVSVKMRSLLRNYSWGCHQGSGLGPFLRPAPKKDAPMTWGWGAGSLPTLALRSTQIWWGSTCQKRPSSSSSLQFVEHSITLGCVLHHSTPFMYSSALNSYVIFHQLHHLYPDYTINTLSLYVTFMADHIKPHSAPSYLAGIVCELEPSYPSWYSPLVVHNLKGSMQHFSNPVQQTSALTQDDLKHVYNHIFQGLCLMTTSCSLSCSLCAYLAYYAWGAHSAWHLLSLLYSKDLMEVMAMLRSMTQKWNRGQGCTVWRWVHPWPPLC